MTSGDFLNYVLGAGLLILIGLLCYAIFYVIKILRSVHSVIDKTEDITGNVLQETKERGVAGLVLSIGSAFLKKRKGGENYGQRSK